ncbi:hypothetical protein JZ751_020431 [Albula glossodonta]|uniref:Ammonium transporter AmtB-like domain-containing protein n=1 Tax=Albula glossodonta TaxID=121402 RepID=A0A8T2N003_9TELE|nr:hypothetical protein JZ751_020431 [Albula glossodonta]
MVFLGFGFLAMFLVRYSFSGSAFSLLVASLSVQWAVLLNGFLFAYHRGKIHIGMHSLATANLCAASALISMGAVLGNTNPAHLILMALIEVTGFMANRWILQNFFQVPPINSIMLLHIFGAFFGLSMSRILYQPGLEPRHEKEKTDKKTTLFSTIGEEGNGGREVGEDSMADLSWGTVPMDVLAQFQLGADRQGLPPKETVGYLQHVPVHIQNASLAGGVAVGVAMSVVNMPGIAMTTGLLAGLMSSLGFRYIKPSLQTVFKCRDTCGVLSVHGMPGIMGWLVGFFIRVSSSSEAPELAMYDPCTLLVTLSLSLCLGACTGFVVKWNLWRPPQDRKCFDDQAFWEFPHLAVRK